MKVQWACVAAFTQGVKKMASLWPHKITVRQRRIMQAKQANQNHIVTWIQIFGLDLSATKSDAQRLWCIVRLVLLLHNYEAKLLVSLSINNGLGDVDLAKITHKTLCGEPFAYNLWTKKTGPTLKQDEKTVWMVRKAGSTWSQDSELNPFEHWLP